MPQMWPMQWEILLLTSLFLIYLMMNSMFLFNGMKIYKKEANLLKENYKTMKW